MRSVNDAQILPPNSDQFAEREQDTPWLTEFRPRRGVRNGDLQTLLANFLPRRVELPAPEDTIVEVEPATQSRVLCHCNWQPEPVRSERMTLLLLHGLEGSSQSQYMLGNADKAWRAGWNVIRMNMRNCGGTEMLSPTLYHSGLSGDVRAVAEFFAEKFKLSQMAWAGYSMGGNMVLKAAGEYGDLRPRGCAPRSGFRRCWICNRRQTRCTMRATACTNGIFCEICWRVIAAKRSCCRHIFRSRIANVSAAFVRMTNTLSRPIADFWERTITTIGLRRRVFWIASRYRR